MYPSTITREFYEQYPEYAHSGLNTINSGRADRIPPTGVMEDWMIQQESRRDSVRAYLSFLRWSRQRFDEVAKRMGAWNSDASHSLGHDKWTVGWAGDTLLSMAASLYALHASGVTGGILECGAFKGSSTACLSWVCSQLGLPLYCADSFEGLPADEGHYGTGDFRGSLAEVSHNVSAYGRPECVHYIAGWYSDSLKGFEPELSLLWVDVDLQQSVVDLMENVFPRLNRNGVIFSDGFTEGVDFEGGKIVNTGCEPAGFHRYFSAHGVDYKVAPGGAKGLALIVPHCKQDEAVLFRADSFHHLVNLL
jgi:hypothetical protein